MFDIRPPSSTRLDPAAALLCEENGSPIFTDPLRPRTHHTRNGCWLLLGNPPETYLFFCSVLSFCLLDDCLSPGTVGTVRNRIGNPIRGSNFHGTRYFFKHNRGTIQNAKPFDDTTNSRALKTTFRPTAKEN